jgi:RNA polymerase sigma-70 factor (ECF subfamily)
MATERPFESTHTLLILARQGDVPARDRLFQRYLPILTRWAHRRLPRDARDLLETNDVVQVTLLRAFMRLEEFQHRGEGSFLAYLRQILTNAIRDEIRKSGRARRRSELDDGIPDTGPTLIEELVGKQALERYEAALARLPAEQQEMIILRIEMGFTYQAIAEAMGKPSPDAARMAIARTLLALQKAMADDD